MPGTMIRPFAAAMSSTAATKPPPSPSPAARLSTSSPSRSVASVRSAAATAGGGWGAFRCGTAMAFSSTSTWPGASPPGAYSPLTVLVVTLLTIPPRRAVLSSCARSNAARGSRAADLPADACRRAAARGRHDGAAHRRLRAGGPAALARRRGRPHAVGRRRSRFAPGVRRIGRQRRVAPQLAQRRAPAPPSPAEPAADPPPRAARPPAPPALARRRARGAGGSGKRPAARGRGAVRAAVLSPNVARGVQPIQVGAPDPAAPGPARRRRRPVEEDPYAQLGLRLGGLTVLPAIQQSIGYDT